jgi:hypothetical protein
MGSRAFFSLLCARKSVAKKERGIAEKNEGWKVKAPSAKKARIRAFSLICRTKLGPWSRAQCNSAGEKPRIWVRCISMLTLIRAARGIYDFRNFEQV